MRLEGFVQKGWGHELIWATNDKYCGKLLKFNKGARFSMHFHAEKEETWFKNANQPPSFAAQRRRNYQRNKSNGNFWIHFHGSTAE